MDIKSIEDLFKHHEQFSEKMRAQMEAVRAGKPTAVARGKEEVLEIYRARREEAMRSKEAVVRRIDEEIGHCDKVIGRLEKEIREDSAGPAKATGEKRSRPRADR